MFHATFLAVVLSAQTVALQTVAPVGDTLIAKRPISRGQSSLGSKLGLLNGLQFATASGAIDVRRYRGKVLYVNFFASWCPPCNREAPLLAVLARKYAPRGLVVIGIDEGEDAGHALRFRNRYGLPYAIALDPSSSAEAPFGEASLPMHVFFDRSGALAVTQSGVLDATSAASTIELLLDAAS